MNHSFPKSHRLSGRKAFAAVFGHKLRKNAGPLSIVARPNSLPHSRLGLSVGRRVGSAVRRNRVKRLLREAYRLTRHELPRGYDLVVVVHPHEEMELADYQRLLASGAEAVARESTRRQKRDDARPQA